MTQDEIIRMAREAGFDTNVFNSVDGDEVIVRHGNATSICISDELKRFASLVSANEREKFLNKLDGVSEKVIYETVKEAVLAEREACAKVCEQIDTNSMIQNWKSIDECVKECATAIRAR